MVFVTSAQVQLMRNGVVVTSVWENNREDGEDSATQVNVSGKVHTGAGVSPDRSLCVLSACRAGNEERRPGVHGADLWQEALQPSAVQQLQRPHCLPRDGRLTACRWNCKGPILLQFQFLFLSQSSLLLYLKISMKAQKLCI